MHLTISGYSTALYSTWYFVKEFRLLFDAGDGIVSSLLGTSGKIKDVFLSHADRDHLTGLFQFNQLNAKPGLPRIHYPKDALSIAAMEQFSKIFDKKVAQTTWVPIADGTIIPLNKELRVKASRNGHVRTHDQLIKSVGYMVQRTKRKLKAEYLGLSANELSNLKSLHGEETITEAVTEDILAYSGDTPVENFGKWSNCKILIHEATFLHQHEIDLAEDKYNLHSTLEEVMAAAAQIKPAALVLGHFSSRYKPQEIDEAIKTYCHRYGISYPVYRLLPGVYYADILAEYSPAKIWL